MGGDPRGFGEAVRACFAVIYTVFWLPGAEAEVARLWVEADNRAEIAQAADAIDDLLRQDPLSSGESRDRGQRIVIVRPLAAKYMVNEQYQIVVVGNVWRCNQRR